MATTDEKDDLGVPGVPPVGLSAISPAAQEDAAAIPHALPHGPRYEMSRDYDLLYDSIRDGLKAFCLVDHRWGDGDPASRDVARVRRLHEWSIQVGVRGVTYGDVSVYDKERHHTERAAFVAECNRMNLEWAIPAA